MMRPAAALVLASGLGLAALAAPARADAKGPITYTPPAWPEPPSAGPLLLRLALATGAVLLAGAAASRAVRRAAGRVPAGRSDARLRLVGNLSLGDGSSLYLLECGGRRFVAGVSRAGLRSLAPLPEPFEGDLDALGAGAG